MNCEINFSMYDYELMYLFFNISNTYSLMLVIIYLYNRMYLIDILYCLSINEVSFNMPYFILIHISCIKYDKNFLNEF